MNFIFHNVYIIYIWDVILPIDELIIFQDGHIAPPTSKKTSGMDGDHLIDVKSVGQKSKHLES